MLEPEKIKNKRFGTVKNGLNPAEVSSFLAELAAEIDSLQKTNSENEEKIVMLVEKINEYREDEEAIKSAIVYAQKESNKLINDAKAKARDMIESAKTEQIRLTEQNAEECERLREEHQAKCNEILEQQTAATQAQILALQDELAAEKANLDAMKAEVTYFKNELTDLYSKQLALIMQLPQMTNEELDEYEQGYDEEYYDEYDDEEYYEDEEYSDEEYSDEEYYDEEYEEEEYVEEYDEKTAEQKHIDEVLNTASFEPIIPKQDSSALQFGKNTK